MARRTVLTSQQRSARSSLPQREAERLGHYILGEEDLQNIGARPTPSQQAGLRAAAVRALLPGPPAGSRRTISGWMLKALRAWWTRRFFCTNAHEAFFLGGIQEPYISNETFKGYQLWPDCCRVARRQTSWDDETNARVLHFLKLTG